MVNTTETYWSVDGESLHTFARNIETLGGIIKPPPFRGEDSTIAYLPGQVWEEKVPDSQVLNLAMWVLGLSESSGSGSPSKQTFQENWNDLVRLLWTWGRQFNLTKRFYDAGGLHSATARGEYAGGMSPTMMGNNGARCVVDVKLADPFFYDDNPQTFNLVEGDNTINVRGNAPTRHIVVTVNGTRDKPLIRVKSPGLPHQVEYNGSIGDGDSVTINSKNYTSMTSTQGTPAYDSELLIRNEGSRYWLILQPGENVVNLSSDFGLGTVQMVVRGAWV